MAMDWWQRTGGSLKHHKSKHTRCLEDSDDNYYQWIILGEALL